MSHPNIPSIGGVTGIVDYLVAKTGYRDPYRFGDMITAVAPALAVIEAKKSDKVGQKSSASQLIAQILCLQRRELESRYLYFLLNTDDPSNIRRSPVGLLTDGDTWRIYFLQPYSESTLVANKSLWEEGGNLYLSRKISAESQEGKRELLGS